MAKYTRKECESLSYYQTQLLKIKYVPIMEYIWDEDHVNSYSLHKCADKELRMICMVLNDLPTNHKLRIRFDSIWNRIISLLWNNYLGKFTIPATELKSEIWKFIIDFRYFIVHHFDIKLKNAGDVLKRCELSRTKNTDRLTWYHSHMDYYVCMYGQSLEILPEHEIQELSLPSFKEIQEMGSDYPGDFFDLYADTDIL